MDNAHPNMRLEFINPPARPGQQVVCSCGKRVELASCLADLDGPAFKAYYCRECLMLSEDVLIARRADLAARPALP